MVCKKFAKVFKKSGAARSRIFNLTALLYIMKFYWKDKFNFIFNKITFGRVINALKVFVSFHLTKWVGKPVQWGLPVTISIEPTTACNLRCPECPSGLRAFTRPTGNLKADFFRKTLDKLSDHLL